MYKAPILFILTALWYSTASGQRNIQSTNAQKNSIYFALGSHRIFFTPGTIHIQRHGNSPLDFTLDKVKGKVEGGLKWETAPQFSYTIGYYFTKKKFGIEYHYDHTKYFVRQNQVVHIRGTIEGYQYDKDTALTSGFFQLEHSDGANYGMFNLVKWLPLASENHDKYSVSLLLKAGIGFVNPKTNSTIMGQHRDDKYHLSGYIAGFESGFRFTAGKTFFATGSFKGSYANYSDFLIANGRGKQKWFSGQFIYLVGAQFPL